MILRRGLVAASLVVLSAAPGAQPVAERVRSGTGSIAGRITEADTKRPLSGVVVTLTAQDLKGKLTTLTGVDGEFVFEGIAPAAYLLDANHPGYVPAQFMDGELQSARHLLWLPPANRHRTGVDLELVPASTISGRITDQQGRPLQGAMVTLMQSVGERAFRISRPGAFSLSNAAGEYGFRQVAEGTYRIGATWIDPAALRAKAAVHSRPTFYPGTDKPEEAAAIGVGRGETHNGIDFVYRQTQTLTVSGHVLRVHSDGPVEMHLVAGASSTRTLQVAEDGAFSATHLQPGRYTIWARAKTVDGTEAAMRHIDVESSDIAGVVLTLEPTARVTGRVVVDDAGVPPLGSMQIAAVIADDDDRVDPLERDRAPIAADGTFELSDMFGERVFHLIGAEPWIIDRVLLGGSEVPAITVGADDVRDVVIVLRRG